MTNPNDAAFARSVSKIGPDETSSDQEGLTKREWFAGMALSGILATELSLPKGISVAEAAVAYADLLIKELSK